MRFFSFLLFLPLMVFGMQANDILEFWFGDLDEEGRWEQAVADRWFNGAEAFDQDITTRFGGLLKEVHPEWIKTPEGRLAHIILYDQFPRNMYRGSKQAFSFDARALMLTLDGIAEGDDLMLHPVERIFFYMPLEHAEDLELQQLSISMFKQLLADAPEDQKAFFKDTYDYALRHHAAIENFGRFPHRNPVLNRETTPDETAFLKTHPFGF